MRIARWVGISLTFVFLGACASAPPPTGEWGELMRGNTAFRTGTITFTGLSRRLDGQKPPVTILACSDSRVPPELVFHQNPGQLFIVRVAGNVADTFGIASIEYAIANEWTKLLVILAHESCGAVEEAIKAPPAPPPPPTRVTPSLDELVTKILESFDPPGCALGEPGCWTRRTRQNAEYAVEDLKERSDVIREAIDVDHLPVVVAYYDLNGEITVWKTVNIEIPIP